MESVGGFQSGFSARKIKRTECKFPKFLMCDHGCDEVIQLVSHVSNEPEFELCKIEAEKMAKVLLDAVNAEMNQKAKE